MIIPDVAFLASAAVLVYGLFVFDATRTLFRDSDAGWHIRSGELILSRWSLPDRDPFSFTRPDKPWFAWEWLADAATGAVNRALGLSGVVWVYLLAIAFGVWLWFQLNWAAGGDFLLACLLAVPMLSTSNLHWLARPHVLSWVFLLIAVLVAEKPPERFGWRHAAGVAVFTALWANVHGSFFFAPLFAAIYATGHYLQPLVWDSDKTWHWRRARWFLLSGIVASLASLANPYGWSLHGHIFHYLTDADLTARIAEFQSFNFHAEGALPVLVVVMVSALGGVLALFSGRLPQFLLSILLVAASLRNARTLPVAALLLLPLANGAITDGLRKARQLNPWFESRLRAYLDYSGRLRSIDASFGGLAWAPVVAISLLLVLRLPAVAGRTGFSPDQFPVNAAHVIESSVPLDARILATDKFGGYLIYRFHPGRRVFFDGRSDFYGASFLKDYGRMMQVRPGWEQIFSKFGFTHALLPDDSPLTGVLEARGWERMYGDRTSVLLRLRAPCCGYSSVAGHPR